MLSRSFDRQRRPSRTAAACDLAGHPKTLGRRRLPEPTRSPGPPITTDGRRTEVPRMDNSFQGGWSSRPTPVNPPTSASRSPVWSYQDGESTLFLHHQGSGARLFTWGSLALLL